jgi:hypothetical protein
MSMRSARATYRITLVCCLWLCLLAASQVRSASAETEVLAPEGGLPDNRAYELVTPPETGGALFTVVNEALGAFETREVRPDGNSVLFNTLGLLPGMEGNGAVDAYQATRGPDGWHVTTVEPTGAQSSAPLQGGTSSDHAYSVWEIRPSSGSLALSNTIYTAYLRKPDGSFEVLAKGSFGQDLTGIAKWITPGAQHIIFSTRAGQAVRLESNAPAAGVAAIYDRNVSGSTEVASLLPGNLPPSSNATFLGCSEDGSTVVFEVGGKIYERHQEVSRELPGSETTYAGVARDGSRVFYVSAGDIFAFEVSSGVSLPVGSGGESTVINISADGSTIYFSSPKMLDGSAGELGAKNLYVWDLAGVDFIAVLQPSDFESYESYEPGRGSQTNLGEWINAINPIGGGGAWRSALHGLVQDPSRTSPDGSTFVFESHGVSTVPYSNNGHAEIYRYVRTDDTISCVSCPTEGPPTSDAQLQSSALTAVNGGLAATSIVENVTDDGKMVFFESRDRLVPGDVNGTRDVYEWREDQVHLITSGRGDTPSFLYGMTADGHDVVFRTGDRLVAQDETGGSGSIYDARVGGGFPPPPKPPAPCALEADCQAPPAGAPSLGAASSASFVGPEAAAPVRKHHKKRRHCKRKHHCKHHHVATHRSGR